MASGEPWQDWVGVAAACPATYPFGTVFVLPGGEEFICMDRGGKVITELDGTIWLDLLVQWPPVPYGTLIRVEVRSVASPGR